MKKLLTAANTKLAVSLGISNAAATALMATLTLGLSAVITGLIVLWDKYSDAQEAAAEKAIKRPVATAVIANPHPETERLVRLSASRLTKKKDPAPMVHDT